MRRRVLRVHEPCFSKNNDARHKKDKPKKRRKFLAEQGGFENGEVRLYIRYANEPISKQRSYAGN